MSSETPTTPTLSPAGGARRRKVHWRSAAYGLVILLAGIVMGFAAGAHYGRDSLFRAFRGGAERGAIGKRMARDLELTPDKTTQMEEIVSRRLAAIREIRESSRPLVTEQMQLMRQEIDQILSEEQRRKLSERFDRMERWSGRGRRAGSGRRGPRHGPGHAGDGPSPGEPHAGGSSSP